MARPGLDKHPKFRLLVRLLGEPRPHVRGYLEQLWEGAYECGDPVIGDAATIEAAAEYPGEPGKLCKALLECGGAGRAGFLEEVPGEPGRYQIHDLFDHAPDYVQKRMAREAQRQARGQTLTESRAEAGRKGALNRWGRDSKPMANGDACHPADSKPMANGCTPAPAPAPAPAPKEGREAADAAASRSRLTPEEIVSSWNKIPSFCKCLKITNERRRHLSARVKESHWVEHWEEALQKAAATPFCLGRNDRGWRADFDWFIRPDTVAKILEGKYDSQPNGNLNGNGHGVPSPKPRFFGDKQQ